MTSQSPEQIPGIVERLRNPPFADRIHMLDLHTEAADHIERLTEACRLQMEEKHKEREEARLWFEKAQEWRADVERLTGALAEYADHMNWHWNGEAWEWNGPDSGQFRGAPSDSDWAYPPQECVDAECGSIARAALSLIKDRGKGHG